MMITDSAKIMLTAKKRLLTLAVRGDINMKIAFICVHNSCRSQMAEAFGRVIGQGAFEVYSAGTHIGTGINPDAVAVMREIGIDMELHQRPKVLHDIPTVDVVVTMGCNVDCPYLPCRHREDWGLEDPTGKSMEDFRRVRQQIQSKVLMLRQRIEAGALE